jgi:hypothetical protein
MLLSSPKIGNSSRDTDKRVRIKSVHLDGLAKVLRGTGLVGDAGIVFEMSISLVSGHAPFAPT